MAASVTSLLATQFLEKLNNEDDTLEQRIKLAHKVFSAFNLLFNRKEELIFTWIIDKISSENQPKEKRKIFNFLEECLSSPRIQFGDVEVRPSVCESIFEVLQTWGFHSTSCSVEVSQRCVIFILQSPIFHHCFKKNVTGFSKLVVAYFNSVSQTSSDEDCAFVVKYILSLFGETLLKRDLRELFAEKILSSIVYALVTLDEVSNSDFERKTYDSICKILFCDAGAASSYINGLRNLDNVKESSEVYVLLQKLLKLPKKCSLESVEYVYPKFLQAFASNTKDENLKFEMFASLCGIIGFKPHEECIGSSVKTVKHFNGITVLLKMLKVVNELNVSVDAEVNDVYFSSWLISLLYSFKKIETLTSDSLKVIREVLLLLDPIVAEQMLEFFVEHVMLVKKSSDFLISVYCDTLKDILDISIKLSRTHYFLSKIFVEAITCLTNPSKNKQYDNLVLEDIFPKTFCKKLSGAINTQPTASCFLILTVLQHNLQKYVLENNLDHNCCPIVVEMIFELTSEVLRGTWVAEHTIPSAVKEKFILILEDLSKVLRSFGMALVNKPLNNRIMTAYFDLCGAWGAINLMMTHYSYDEKRLIEDQTNSSASNLAYVLTFLPDITWDILIQRTIRAGDIVAKHALFQLMEQKMSALREFEEGSEGPASLTARFLLENADDDWMCEHANSLLPFLGPQDLMSLAATLACYKQHHKIVTLLRTVEFQESNDMVAAMGLMLLREIAKKCESAGRPLMKKLFDELSLSTILSSEAEQVVSEEIKTNLCDVAVILSKVIQEDDYKTDFQISSFIQRKLDLLLELPISYLQLQTQVVMLLVLFAATKCLPYSEAIYDIITGILDNRHPLEFPDTINWPALLQWIAVNSNDYPQKLILLKCLLQSAFRDSSSIGDLVHSLCKNKSEPNIILCTLIATNLEKIIKKKRNIDGERKSSLQQSCHKDLYSCIKNIVKIKPALHWLPVYHMVLNYHLNPKNVDIDHKAEEKIFGLLSDYINIIVKSVQNIKDDKNNDTDDFDSETNAGYLEIEGDFLMLIMQHRSKFGYVIPEDLVSTLWTALASHLPVQKLQVFLQSASNDEFKNTVQDLTKMTDQLLEDSSLIRKVCLLWKVLLMSQLGCEKIILRNNAVDQLSNTLLQLAFQWRESKNVLNVHNLLGTLITSLKVKMTIQHVEMCLEVISAIPSDASPKLINKALDVLSAMLRYRTTLMIDLIPQFLQRFTHIVSIISAASHVPNISHPVEKLADCAFGVEKLSNVIVKSGKDFARVAHFAVSDIVYMFERYTVESSVKIHLQNAIFCFLSLCDSHAIAYQMRILSPASKEIFKRIHSDYCKHHKFTGKV